ARERMGSSQEASSDYRLALELDPDCWEARVQLVRLHLGGIESRDHLSILEKAHPDSPEVWLLSGMDRFQRGQPEEAEKYFNMVLTAWPDHPQACHEFGKLALQECQHARAEHWFRQAM